MGSAIPDHLDQLLANLVGATMSAGIIGTGSTNPSTQIATLSSHL